MNLSENIKALRKYRRLSQEKFADKIGEASRGTVAKWETGETKPDIEQIDRMATYFNVTIDDLIHKDFSIPGAVEEKTIVEDTISLIISLLKGNDELLKLVDVNMLSNALIEQLNAKASKMKDVNVAIKLYAKAGALGDQNSYIKARNLVQAEVDKISNNYTEERLDEYLKYKELLDELESRIWDDVEAMYLSEMLPYEQNEDKRAIENARREYAEKKIIYDRLILEEKFDDAKSVGFWMNYLAKVGYSKSDRKQYIIDLSQFPDGKKEEMGNE